MGKKTPDRNPYRVARDRKLEALKDNFDIRKIEQLGAEVDNAGRFILPLLRWRCFIQLDPFSFLISPCNTEAGLTCQILALDYLSAEDPDRPCSLISFRDFAGTRGYFKPYEGRVIQRLTHTAGETEERFFNAAISAGGKKAGHDPLRFFFRFFPLFELQVIRYKSDSDFPHSCNILFSDNALSVLSTESMIVSAETLVSIMLGGKP